MRMIRARGACGLLLVGAALFCAPAAKADPLAGDPMIEGAKMCTQYLPRHEREYGIPMHLLAAIASTESGRYHQGLGLRLPWPWTINAEGQGYFFETQAEAIAAVRRLQAKGVRSIDVGCMQVNLMHHPNAFATLEQAFDPAYNIAYAASFLHSNFEELKSWKSATAAYHSRTPYYGSQYVVQVFDTWHTILTKVAEAKSGTLTLARDKWNLPSFSRATDVDNHYARPLQAASNSHYARRVHPHLHSITMVDTSRENGVLVIRPGASAAEDKASAEAASGDTPVIDARAIQASAVAASSDSAQFNPRSKIVRLDAAAGSVSASHAPQFVFAN